MHDDSAMTTNGFTRGEARILGQPPRIAPLEVGELDDKLIEIVLRMIRVNQAVDSREPELLGDLLPADGQPLPAEVLRDLLARIPEIVRTMLRHPDLFARQVDVGLQLLGQGSLAPRDRELCILRVAWICQAPYPWGEHVIIARKAGVDADDIERIILGADAPGWNGRTSSSTICSATAASPKTSATTAEMNQRSFFPPLISCRPTVWMTALSTTRPTIASP